MKKIFALVLTLCLLFSLAACGEEKNAVSNPWHTALSMEDATGAVGFDFDVPDKIEDYDDSVISYLEKETIEITYYNDSDAITIRKGLGGKDISGDYNTYDEEIEIDGITMKCNNSEVFLATWADDEYSYSFSTTKGMTQEDVLDIISEIE